MCYDRDHNLEYKRTLSLYNSPSIYTKPRDSMTIQARDIRQIAWAEDNIRDLNLKRFQFPIHIEDFRFENIHFKIMGLSFAKLLP